MNLLAARGDLVGLVMTVLMANCLAIHLPFLRCAGFVGARRRFIWGLNLWAYTYNHCKTAAYDVCFNRKENLHRSSPFHAFTKDNPMILDVNVQLDYEMIKPTDLILQIEAPNSTGQHVLNEKIDLGTTGPVARVAGEGGVGQRVLIRMESDFVCTYQARIDVDRPVLDIASLAAVQPHQLPSEAVRCLMPSRYCPAEFLNFVSAEFGDIRGGQQIEAMRDWIFEKFEYVSGSSNAQTTAIETFVNRQGVCRDYAHVLIAMARASGIPARFVSAYAPHVTPQDFHAVVEVFLEDAWHLVDATGMASSDQIARIGVGLDAAEVSFLSSYDLINFKAQSVQVTAVE